MSLVLAVSNRHLWVLSGAASKRFQVHLQDQQESAFICIYFVASSANVALAFLALLAAANLAIQQRQFPNSNELQNEVIQRLLGDALYYYTCYGFLIFPLLIEIVFGLWFRHMLVALYVRTRKIDFIDAVTYMVPPSKHLTRYADIVRNMLVVAVVLSSFPFRAMGALLFLFFAILITYIIDRLTVVRDFTHFHYSTDLMDSVAMRLLALPLCVLALNLYAQSRGSGYPASSMVGVAVLHMLIYQFFISVARRDSMADMRSGRRRDYHAVDRERAIGWFSGNPIHGLREKHLLKKTIPPRVVCAGVFPHWNPRWYFAAEEIKSRFYNGEYTTRQATLAVPGK
jgi:hypothetical protein